MIESFADIHYFLEAAKVKNFSRASERLGITQPTLSRSIKKLEEVVGTDLFIRSKKGVELTPAGKEIFLKSESILNSWDQIKSNALGITNEIRGNIKLGAHPSVAIHTISHSLSSVLENHPNLNIKLVHELSRVINEMIISFQIDLGIVVNPIKHPDLILTKLGYDEVCLWKSKKTNKNNDVNSNQAVLICDESLSQVESLKKKFKNQKLVFSRVLNSSSLEVITQLVSDGVGIGIIPSRIVKVLHPKTLEKIQKTPVFKDEFYLSYRVENKNIASIKFLVDHFKSSFKI